MGSSYTNISLRGPQQQQVVELLVRIGCEAYVSPTINGFTVVYEKEAEDQRVEKLAMLAQALSKFFNTLAFGVSIYDDNALGFVLFENGSLIAENFSTDIEAVEDKLAITQQLCRAFAKDDAVETVLNMIFPPETADDDLDEESLEEDNDQEDEIIDEENFFEQFHSLFGSSSHEELARLLGLPAFSVGYGYRYLTVGEYPPEFTPENLVLIKSNRPPAVEVPPEDILNALLPEFSGLLKPATKLTLKKLRKNESLPLLSTHFGGTPYAEAADEWPSCAGCDEPLAFICQINFQESLQKPPENIALLTFYYCLNCRPIGDDEEEPGKWRVMIYQHPSMDQAVTLDQASADGASATYKVAMSALMLMPDFNELELWHETQSITPLLYHSLRSRLKTTFNNLEWGAEIGTFIGRYPQWVKEYEETPICEKCEFAMELLVQLSNDSSDALRWLDSGALYLFCCLEHRDEIQLVIQ